MEVLAELHAEWGVELFGLDHAPERLLVVLNELSQQDRLGAYGVVNPPLRSRSEVRALWSGLAHVDLIATDHAVYDWADIKRKAHLIVDTRHVL